jgi:YfiH family protein
MLGTPAGSPATAGRVSGTGGAARLSAVPGAAPPLLTWDCFDPAVVQVALSTRDGGVSTGSYASLNLGLHVGDADAAVLENRGRVASAMGVRLDDLVFAEQVHQPNVAVVDAAHRGRGARSAADALPATDAVVTTTPGVVLVVMIADCVPLVLHDPMAEVLACVHAGWGGTVRGVTPAAVRAMQELGSDPANIVVGIGPAISANTYQVGDDVAGAARTAFGDRLGEVLRPDGTGRYLFDLVGAARLQLTAAGVPVAQIHDSGLTTGPGTPFYSHRAERPCGRFAVLARLLPEGRP